MYKNLRNLGIGSNFLNLINGIYKKTRTSITFNGKTLDTLLLRSRSRQGYSLPYSVSLEVLASVVREILPDTYFNCMFLNKNDTIQEKSV